MENGFLCQIDVTISNTMKNIWFYFILTNTVGIQSCTHKAPVETEVTEEQISEEQNEESSSVLGTNQWDAFRFGIVNNDPDFDLLKYYDPEQVSREEANTLLDDDYTKMMLESTTYGMLEDEIFDGISAKAFYVIIASDGISIGTIYYFRETSYGLQLLGTMPY
jgi:hypothetical protein